MTKTFLDRLHALIKSINRAALWVAGISMVLMAAHVSFDAFGKYLFSTPIPATLEVVAYYYMPAVAALAIAHVQINDGHVSLTMLFDSFPKAMQRAVLVVNGILMIAFIGLIAWLAGREALRKFDIGEYMFGEYPIIIWPGRFIFTFGLAFMCLVILAKVLELIFLPTGIDPKNPKDMGEKA